MGGGTETIVDVSVTRLINEPHKVYKAVMRDVFTNAPKGTRAMMSALGSQFVDNQKLFHSKYLETLGYEPTVNTQYKNIDTALVEDYIETELGVEVISINSARYDAPSSEEFMLHHLQNTYVDFNLALKEFTYTDGKRYRFFTNTVVSQALIESTCYRISAETVAEDAASKGVTVSINYDVVEKIDGINYWKYRDNTGTDRYVKVEYLYLQTQGLDYTAIQYIISTWNNKLYSRYGTETQNGEMGIETYTTWTLSARSRVYLDASGKIKVEVVKQNLTTPRGYKSQYYVEAINGAMSDIKNDIEIAINNYFGTGLEKLIATYTTSTGAFKIIIATVNEDNISGYADIEAYPIIPLKDNYNFTKDTRQRKAILNKIGMTGSDFESSLKNKKLRHASIMFTVSMSATDKTSIKYLYNLLDNLGTITIPGWKGGTRTVHAARIRFQGMDLTTQINMSTEIKSGSIGPIGTYAHQIVTEENQVLDPEAYGEVYVTEKTKVKVLRKQINELYYSEIRLASARSIWRINGKEKSGKLLDDSEDNCVVPLLQTAMDGFVLEESLYMMGKSLCLVVLSVTKVKTKWYQTGFFKFILLIVIVVVAYYAGPEAGAALFNATLAAGGTVAAASTLALVATAVVYAGAAVSVLGMMGVDTGAAGTILGIAGLALGGYTMYLNGLAAGVGQISTLQLANGLVGAASMASDINAKGTMAKIQESYDQLNQKMKELEEEGKELYADIQKGMWVGIADREPELLYYMSSTDYMCNYNSLYDYDSLIDAAIGS